MRSYWVVSPNVTSSTRGALSVWKKIIRQKHVAIMGYRPNHEIGRRFIEAIKQ
jgi:hypothetical protein